MDQNSLTADSRSEEKSDDLKEWDDNKVRERLLTLAEVSMDELHEEEMEGYDHEFSKKFDKKMKKMMWSERYFGSNIRIGYVLRKAAVVAVIALSLATAGTVSAQVFDFRPWEALPFFGNDDDEEDKDAQETAPPYYHEYGERVEVTPVPASPKDNKKKDEMTVSVATEARTAVTGTGSDDLFPLHVTGATGNCTYALEEGTDSHFSIENGGITVSDSTPAGSYTIHYRVLDEKEKTAKNHVTIHVVEAVTIKGVLLGNDGTKLGGASLSFTTEDGRYASRYFEAYVDDEGGFRVAVAPEAEYSVFLSWQEWSRGLSIRTQNQDIRRVIHLNINGEEGYEYEDPDEEPEDPDWPEAPTETPAENGGPREPGEYDRPEEPEESSDDDTEESSSDNSYERY